MTLFTNIFINQKKSIMKKVLLSFAAIFTILLTLVSCERPACPDCNEEASSTLTISLESDATKSNIANTQEEDNTITTVDVFVFRNTDPTSADYQKLDTYKRFANDALEDLTLTTTTGPKTICVIVNEHTNAFKGVTNLTKFRELVTNLKDELVGSYTMYGEINETLGTTTSIAMSVKRHISRIGVTSIKTKFAGTPYADMTLSNIKLYLVNAHAQKVIYNNASSPTTPLVYNSTKLVGEDANATEEANLIYEPLTGTIGDVGITTPYFFYCYSNETDDIPSCTKMVLQADLDGVTYYYPILINQNGYGYSSSNGYYGVRRNTTYSYGITVTRPGSLDPNTPLVPGTLELTLNVDDWAVIPHFDKEF